MNDPHVEWLVYRLETAAALVFQNPEPREDDTSSFHLRLEDGRSNPGSNHRSDIANDKLEARTPGKAHPRSGMKPGGGKVGTVPTTPGHSESR